MNSYKGKLITFEGGEGSGKSTQIRLLKDYLECLKYDVILSREPGGNDISEEVRRILKDPKYKGVMSSRAELLLFEAARCQIVDQNLKPWLEQGKIVIFDRFYDSTVAYQGYARGIDMNLIETLNSYATNGIKPDITFLLDVDVEIGFSRVRKRSPGSNDRMESEKKEFYEKVRTGYRSISAREERFKIICTSYNDVKTIHELVCSHVDKLLK